MQVHLLEDGSIFFNMPPSFLTESLQYVVVIGMLGKFVVPVRSKPGENLLGHGSPPSLPLLVLLTLCLRWETQFRDDVTFFGGFVNQPRPFAPLDASSGSTPLHFCHDHPFLFS